MWTTLLSMVPIAACTRLSNLNRNRSKKNKKHEANVSIRTEYVSNETARNSLRSRTPVRKWNTTLPYSLLQIKFMQMQQYRSGVSYKKLRHWLKSGNWEYGRKGFWVEVDEQKIHCLCHRCVPGGAHCEPALLIQWHQRQSQLIDSKHPAENHTLHTAGRIFTVHDQLLFTGKMVKCI